MSVVYDFWKEDEPTKIVLEYLNLMKMPFTEEVRLKKRNDMMDEWLIIRVRGKELIEWLKEQIENLLTIGAGSHEPCWRVSSVSRQVRINKMRGKSVKMEK